MRIKKEQDLLVCSFRYALGRRTGMPSIIAGYLREDWDKLNGWQQKQIHDDIKHATEHGLAGDDCDVQTWKSILLLKVEGE